MPKKALRGFSLMEALLATFVLTVGLLSVIALITSSLRYSMDTRDAIIATELAQEGIELIRNVRDNDLAAGGSGFSSLKHSDKHCHFDYDDAAAALGANCFPAVSNSTYYLQYSGGLYAHSGAGSSRFSRDIFLRYASAPEESLLVRSFVYRDPILFTPPNNGDSTDCTVANKCVFTEATLTAWK